MALRTMEQRDQCEFELFDVKVCVKTNMKGIADLLRTTYSAFPSTNGHSSGKSKESHYSVIEKRRKNPEQKRFLIFQDHRMVYQTQDRDPLVPYLKWFVNNDVLDHLTSYYQLHAGVVSRDGKGIILPGPSRSGKTTLVLGLLMNGFRYLSDEFALIDPKTQQVIPFPRNLYLYKSRDAAPVLSLSENGKETASKLSYAESTFSFLFHVPVEQRGEPCPVNYVIFPTYSPGEKPRLTKMSKGSALLGMIKASLNFFDHSKSATDILVDLLQNADCYSLTTGHLRSTVDLLLDLSDHAR